MTIGRVVHWIGVFFVSLAAILLLITCIGAPAVHDIGLLKVQLKNASDIRQSSVVFGPFGYCVLDVAPAQTDQDYCSHASVGYLPAQEMRLLVPATTWTTWKGHNLDLMTVAYVLFPIAFTIAFLAAAFAFCGAIGSLIAATLSAAAFIVTFPVMVVAFVSMGYLKSHVQGAGLSAHFGTGMWTCLVAFIFLFFAMILLLFSCCSGHRGRTRDKKHYHEKDHMHRDDSERGLNDRTHHHNGNNHHYGRDAAIGGAGVGAYEAERHHHNHNRDDSDLSSRHHGRHAPANAAAARAGEGLGGHHNHGALGGTTNRGNNNYDSVLVDQDRNNSSHHYGRDAALAGGAVAGASALHSGRHDHNRGIATGDTVAAAPGSPREHKLRDTMRDSGGVVGADNDARYSTARQGRVVNVPPASSQSPNTPTMTTHYHPSVTTSTETYADERGVRNSGLHTTSYDPHTGVTTRH